MIRLFITSTTELTEDWRFNTFGEFIVSGERDVGCIIRSNSSYPMFSEIW